MKNGLKVVALVCLCSTLSCVVALEIYSHKISLTKEVMAQQETSVDFASRGNSAEGMRAVAYSSDHTPQDFAAIAEKSLNGVVNIRCEITESRRRQQYVDPFEFFFGPGFGQGGPREQQLPTKVSIGSGVIISTDGYILTNNHVVENASKITVNTNDNREFNARVIGTDPSTDVALLKVEAKNLQPLPFGDSEALRVGEWVLAIGNPFNLSSTVTAGIVSAKGRSSVAAGELKIASFIQTDAAVNPGNSGGALVNTKGELVGINTMIYSQTGNYAGYSFAIPVSIARKVVADIKKYGAVQRAVLGIMGYDIHSEVMKKYDLKVTEGAVVGGFANLSVAKVAGVKEGDVITQVNGVRVRNMAQLQEQISKYRPGDKISLTLNRKGERLTKELVLKNAQGNTDVVKNLTASSIGAAFKPLRKEYRQRLGVDYGVEVVGVDEGRFQDAGITEGFIILSINHEKVSSATDVENIVNKVIATSSDKVLFIKGVLPSGRVRYVAVDLGE